MPDGASVEVDPGKTTSYTLDGVDVYPVQPEAVDADTNPPNFLKAPFAAKPFELNSKAYKKDGLVPAAPADADVLGTSRDLTIGGLNIPAAQYDAADKKLKVLTSVDVAIDFKGGSHEFSEELGSPWEQPQRRLAASLINAGIVKTKKPFVLRPCGEEMLVITNPATLAAANQFSTARNAAGILTRVVQTGAGRGSDRHDRGRDPDLHPRPAHAVALHPPELRHDHRRRRARADVRRDQRHPVGPAVLDANDADELPDVAVGRIIGNDLAQVTAAVTKIIGYETTAPTGAFLTRATVAAQFQDTDGAGQVNDGQENRTFIQFAEKVRNGLAARGVTVDRIYDDEGPTNPLKFNDGTDLPAALKKPTFAWDGDGADVTRGVERGPLPDDPPRPRLVGRLGHARLHDRQRRRADQRRDCCRS